MRIDDDDAEERKMAIRVRRQVKIRESEKARGAWGVISIYSRLSIFFGTFMCCSNHFPIGPGGYNHSIPPMMTSDKSVYAGFRGK
jgi:hypothetical protein